MAALLVRNGTVVSSRGVRREDLLIEGELVQAVGDLGATPADQTLDATGCYVFPGGIDVHTHFELPQMGTVSSDTFPTGTAAALWGGTTSIIDFANQVRGESLHTTLQRALDLAKGRSACDYGFHIAITDVNSSSLAEIPALVRTAGVTSFKTFLAYDALMLSNDDLERVMRVVAAEGGLVTVHAEIGDQIKAGIAAELAAGHHEPRSHRRAHSIAAEAEATRLALQLASQNRCPVYIVHVSCADALAHIRAVRSRGQSAFGETCPQYLFLDESRYALPFEESAKYVMSPPLRTPADQEALMCGLVDGSLDTLATDHCPFFMRQKEAGRADFSKIPNGAPGVEHRMELLYSAAVATGRLTLERFVELTARRPAELFGLYPQKGDLCPGGDADLVIFDPNARHTLSASTHHMNVDYSCFEGMALQGRCRTVILRGQVMVHEGRFVGPTTAGRYLCRLPHHY